MLENNLLTVICCQLSDSRQQIITNINHESQTHNILLTIIIGQITDNR